MCFLPFCARHYGVFVFYAEAAKVQGGEKHEIAEILSFETAVLLPLS